MIVTLTPNPSLDRTLELPDLRVGEVNRARAAQVHAGGKGVNVARALVQGGTAVRAVLPVGGPEGEHLTGLLAATGIDTRVVAVGAPTRTNITLVTEAGTTKVNAPGPRLTPAELELLTTAVVAALEDATWLVACGSLPLGVPSTLFPRLIAHARRLGVRTAVDSSGAALRAAIEAGPDLLKPNAWELAELLGRPMRTVGDVLAAAAELREAHGVGAVLASLGGDGAVLVDDRGAWHATADAPVVRSTVGAGDAALAGFLAAGGAGPRALSAAVAHGAAAVGLPGSAMPGPADVAAVVTAIAPAQPPQPLTHPIPAHEPIPGGTAS